MTMDLPTVEQNITTIQGNIVDIKDDVNDLKIDVNGLKEDVNCLKTDLNTLRLDVREIKEALLGDAYGNRGLIEKVKYCDSRIVRLEETKRRLNWLVAGAVMVGTFISTLVYIVANIKTIITGE